MPRSQKAQQARDYLESIQVQVAEMVRWPDNDLEKVWGKLRAVDDALPSDREALDD